MAQVQSTQWARLASFRLTTPSRQGKFEEARQLFDEMPQRDVVSCTFIIAIYLKHKDFPNAEKLFYSIRERNVVSDNAMFPDAEDINSSLITFENLKCKRCFVDQGRR
ncbi:hypothetical protein HAX54_043616 [Datura stramonium]|uniref:Pentatricopeptide repeat-containing protein n=1 Tax=Datura stramonium TaxID=4076 RepID=A0ABS8W4W8_DATST|nr:hypothetical protein [Datura stramonium]